MTQPWEWHLHLNEDERREFFRDLREAAAQAEVSGDIEPVWKCLREWRTTAVALADPQARAVLTSPVAPDDFTEVRRPAAEDDEMTEGVAQAWHGGGGSD